MHQRPQYGHGILDVERLGVADLPVGDDGVHHTVGRKPC